MKKNFASTAQIHSSVVFGPNCREVQIGHGVKLSRDLYIDVEFLRIGDYVTIHHGSVLHGKTLRIGHNCWVGHMTILDASGGLLDIGNNVGIGAHSQVWTHMKFGDTLRGCRWNSSGRTTLEDDVWLVGHSIVSPIIARRGSMLMVGGVATKDMEANHVYAGTPARDVTDKFGPQFRETTFQMRSEGFRDLVREYEMLGNQVDWIAEGVDCRTGASSGLTFFDPNSMTYLPTYSEEEVKFMRFMLYDKAKFLPQTSGPEK